MATEQAHASTLGAAGSWRQRGVALVIVLWILVLISITVGTFSVLATTENLQSHQVVSGTRARYAAEAGLYLAAMHLSSSDIEQRWLADGRPYQARFGEAELTIRINDEQGKLDINSASELALSNLLTAHGMEEQESIELIAAIQDWVDGDDLMRPYGAELDDYQGQGLAYGPANQNFQMVEELQQVLGMSHDLYRKIEPGITVFSNQSDVMAAFAPREALLAIPGMTTELVDQFIAQREAMDPANPTPLLLPDGSVVTLGSPGDIHTVRVRADMPNGIWEEIEVTLSLSTDQGELFTTLRWREGIGS